MSKLPSGFVPLKTLKQGAGSTADILAEIRQIYFKSSKQTIEHDFAHALELLKALPTEDEREKATVFMHGLAEMRRDWGARSEARSKGKGQRAKGNRGEKGGRGETGRKGKTGEKG